MLASHTHAISEIMSIIAEKPHTLYTDQPVAETICLETHPQFQALYKPVLTPGEGNCLWNAISIALTRKARLMTVMRLVTALIFMNPCVVR